jgi:ABC-type iron transport system FetAB permease component
MLCKMESLTSDTNIVVLALAFTVFVVVGSLLVARDQDCHLSKRLSLRHIATFLQLSYIHNYLQSHTHSTCNVYNACVSLGVAGHKTLTMTKLRIIFALK